MKINFTDIKSKDDINENISIKGLTRDNPTFDFIKRSYDENFTKFKIEKDNDRYRFIFINSDNEEIYDSWNTIKSFTSRMHDYALLSNDEVLNEKLTANDIIDKYLNGSFWDLTIAKNNFNEIVNKGNWLLFNDLSDNRWFKEWFKPRVNHLILRKYPNDLSEPIKEMIDSAPFRNNFKNLYNLIGNYIIQNILSNVEEKYELTESEIKLEREIDDNKGITNIPISIENIHQLCKNGKVLIPSFQREYVWDGKQITSLLNSIVKKYPIGSLLATNSFDRFNIKNAVINSINMKKTRQVESSFILDGQQRLTSILMIMGIERLKIRALSPENEELRNDMKKIEDILFYENEFHWKKIDKLSKTEARNFSIYHNEKIQEEVINKIKNYEIPITFLSKEYSDNLIDIFSVINIGSRKLTNIDLMHSILFSISEKDHELDLYTTLKHLKKNKVIKQFNYDDETIVQLWRLLTFYKFEKNANKNSIQNLSTKVILDEFTKKDSKTLLKNFYRAQESLLDLIIKISQVLEKICGYYAFSELPNKSFVLLLSAYVLEKELINKDIDDIDNDEINSVIGTIFKYSLDSRYSSGTIAKITTDINQLINDEYIFNKNIDSIIENAKIDYSSKSPLYKMAIAILRLQEPVSLIDGETKVRVFDDKYSPKDNDQHHFLPRKAKLPKGIEKFEESKINSIGNIALISSGENRKQIGTKTPFKYINNLNDAQISRISQTHLIDIEILKKINLASEDEFDKEIIEELIAKREEVIIKMLKDKWLDNNK